MGRPAVVMENVGAVRDDVRILSDINIQFPFSETSVIMGPSGCGKSILLKLAAGLIPPEEGKVFIDGKDVLRIPEKELVALRKSHGFVFQDSALWANKTVYQNLSLPLEFHFRHFSQDEIRRRIRKTLELAGYTDSENLRPAQLSSGEQKMVSFARAIVTEPHLIFLDDPTIAVDHEGVDKILKIIRQLKEDRRTLIISTHDPMLSSMVADNLVIMKKGQIIEHGTFKEVVRSENREVVRILSDVLSETSTYAGDILDLMDDGVINDSS